MREAVRVGDDALLGEVVSIDGDEIVAQVYEDTTGLKPGAIVEGDLSPLAIPLGPGLLGHIFDGLLRPLGGADTPFVQPGMRQSRSRSFVFTPRVGRGAAVRGGTILGEFDWQRAAFRRSASCRRMPRAKSSRWSTAASTRRTPFSACCATPVAANARSR